METRVDAKRHNIKLSVSINYTQAAMIASITTDQSKHEPFWAYIPLLMEGKLLTEAFIQSCKIYSITPGF